MTTPLRIASWNVNSLRVRFEHVLRYLEQAQPDVLCLQETKVEDHKFPAEALAAAGYPHQLISGQKTYNGVAILSKHPLVDPQLGFTVPHPAGLDDEQRRMVAATVSGVRVFCCYVPMGTAPGHAKFTYKLQWLARLRGELNQLAATEPVLVCGDLNVALGELDTWDAVSTDGSILCHPHERMVLRKVMDWGLHDAFRALHPDERTFSWWDYRGGAYPRNRGFRIDYVLLSKPLLERCVASRTWADTRAWEPTASDHIPVSVDLS